MFPGIEVLILVLQRTPSRTSLHHLSEGPEVGEWRLHLRQQLASSTFSVLPETQPQHVLHMRHFRGPSGCGVEHGTVGTVSCSTQGREMTKLHMFPPKKKTVSLPKSQLTSLSIQDCQRWRQRGACRLSVNHYKCCDEIFLYRHDYCNHCSSY